MEIQVTYYLLGICIVGPLLLGVLAWLVKPWAARGLIAVLAAVVTSAAGIMLCIQGTQTVSYQIPHAAAALELLVILVVVALGLNTRSAIVVLLGVVQGVLAVLELLGPHHSAGASGASVFVIDRLAMIMVLIISLIGSSIVVYGIGYMKRHEHHAPPSAASTGRFFFFLIGFLGFMNGLVLTDNMKWLSVFWECTTLCSFFLIGHDGTDEAKKNARRALIINTIGGACMSVAAAYSMHRTGTEEISKMIGLGPAILLPVALLCVASMTKSAQMPFQSWLLGAMIAPTPVSALLHSSTMVKAGSYLILRIAPAITDTHLAVVVAIAGAFTFALTSALAISQGNGKRVLAYSTIANLGLIVACVGIGTPMAYSAALIVLIFHAVTKALLFLCMGAIEQETGSRQIEDMSGIMFKMPLTTTIAAVGMVAMIMPPLGMLIGKWMAVEAAVRHPVVLFLLILGSALTVFFWAKWIGRIITASHHEKYDIEKMPFSMSSMLVVNVAAVIFFGFAAVPLYVQVIKPMVLASWSTFGSKVLAAVALTDPVLAEVDFFMQWPVFMILLVVLFAVAVTMSVFGRGTLKAPFLCGENVTDEDALSYEFKSLMDQKSAAHITSYYFPNIFGEATLTSWANFVALLIILSIFARIVF